MSTLDAIMDAAASWTDFDTLSKMICSYFRGPRDKEEVERYRVRKGASFKKLGDEIVPVMHYLQRQRFAGQVRFAMNDDVPDCYFRDAPGSSEQGIEVTGAQARERIALSKEMNAKGWGRGFLGLPDHAPQSEFNRKLASPRIMYSTEQALDAISGGIRTALIKKDHSKYAGHDLLIHAPLASVPRQRWDAREPELRDAAAGSPFRQVHVVDPARTTSYHLRLK